MLGNFSDFFKEKFRIIYETIVENFSDNWRKNINKIEKNLGNY